MWQSSEGARRIRRLTLTAVRAVEGQHRVSTRKLVDSDDEQRVLEELIERGKPRLARLPGIERLHYLLSTSFRYPPLRHGSRFGSRTETGIWYGSRTHRTVFAEVAYYRLVFLEGTAAALDRLMVELTAFEVAIAAKRGVDLTRPPFSEHTAQISSRVSYATSQRLGHEMREAGVQAFVFRSARDARGGDNVGLFDPMAFVTRAPRKLETWLCVAEKSGVEVSRKDFFRRESFAYPRSDFEVRGKLPVPAT